MKNDKWIKRFKVQSSSGNGDYIVAIDKEGNYGCSCPVWKFKRLECHHIKQIKLFGGDKIETTNKPEYVLAKVFEPKLKDGKILCPLIPFGDIDMEATIDVFLMKYGYSFSEVRELRHIPAQWTKSAILNHIEKYGMKKYPDTYYKY